MKSIYRRGIKDGLPIFMGYVAVSFTFGIQARLQGLTVFQSGILSWTNVTSAGQFAGLTSIATQAALWEVIITQFIINSRYMLMSSALSQKIPVWTPFQKRALMAAGVTDEVFALSIAYPGELNPVYTYGLMTAAIPGWVLGTVLGVVSGSLLPVRAVSALSIALYGMLIAVIVPPSKKQNLLKGIIAISMICSFLFSVLPVVKEISSGIRLIFLTLVITGIAALLFPIKEENYE
ncbi:AzlC family ABC transporter permease [Gallicola sp. Sow4_E12]|uniref:AzlC family ABC transporter permease n=1 Tax=Gallicola sp. Sow4_E12 TaxID=3438785 RepID=UPI003F93735D